MTEPGFKVLVVFGPSATGKSSAAKALGRRFGIPWLQVDDFRLALQHTQRALLAETPGLHSFEQTRDIWNLPVETLRDAFIGVAAAMVPAMQIVIDNHVAIDEPIVLEGDGIFPALFGLPTIRPVVERGIVRACCVTAVSADALLETARQRGRGLDVMNDAALVAQAEANWQYGQWLGEESRRHGIPVIASRPFETLPDRILAHCASD